ncbi:MAG TPA: VOC family protein [Candidatus Polarisedimenticolaceae bacterium]|nr:VOC family protein [Candidatus Polarisedimenticolaceae bacterium]
MSFGIAPPGFRLPQSTHVGAAHLQVADLTRSLAWYRTILGFRVLRQDGESAVLGADRPLLHLHLRPGARPVPRRGAYGLFHVAILLPGRPALGACVAHLGEQDVRVGMADHAVSEALYLWDPDNLGIEVYADRPRSTWKERRDELVMTTDPLDAPDLVRAAGGARWQGVPDGTTLGHLHLHVGDLDTARDFYHLALGLDVTVWHYPGALFLSAGGYHHHLGTNTWSPGPAAAEDEARLLHWELVLPHRDSVLQAGESLRGAGYGVEQRGDRIATADPWGTALHLTPRA